MIIVGLGFGDEGKGLATSFLASQKDNPIVIRYNGGHQAGHTVVYENNRHVFSSFNSATLQGVPTYWSKFCTFYPTAFLNEYEAIQKICKHPITYYIHAEAIVTTPFDVIANQETERKLEHGSVGVGFGQTIKRHSVDYYKLFVRDLFHENVLRAKLANIASYYGAPPQAAMSYYSWKDKIDRFVDECKQVTKLVHLIKDGIDEFELLDQLHEDVIFEGAQGVLLDMDYGFFPNVTRSNTTSLNALSFLKSDSVIANKEKIEIYYVTRTYQTRHGNGFMTNEDLQFYDLKNAENETNKHHDYQGHFRKSILDIDLLRYAIECDNCHSYEFEKNLIITCVDQTGENFQITEKGELKTIHVKELAPLLGKFNKVFAAYGDDFSKVKELK